MRAATLVLTLCVLAGPAAAQPRPSPAMQRLRQDLRECLIRNAGYASAHAEATRDGVADYAAKKCEARFIREATRRKLMSRAEAQVEVNMTAYQFTERILSQ